MTRVSSVSLRHRAARSLLPLLCSSLFSPHDDDNRTVLSFPLTHYYHFLIPTHPLSQSTAPPTSVGRYSLQAAISLRTPLRLRATSIHQLQHTRRHPLSRQPSPRNSYSPAQPTSDVLGSPDHHPPTRNSQLHLLLTFCSLVPLLLLAGMIPAHLQQSADYTRLPSNEDVRQYQYNPPPSSYATLLASSSSSSHSSNGPPANNNSNNNSSRPDPRSRSFTSLVEPMTRAAQSLVKSSVPDAIHAHFPDSASEDDGVEGLAAQFPHPPDAFLPPLSGGGFAAAAFAGSTPRRSGSSNNSNAGDRSQRQSVSSQKSHSQPSRQSQQSLNSQKSQRTQPPPKLQGLGVQGLEVPEATVSSGADERRSSVQSQRSVRSAASATPSSPTIPTTPVPSSPVSSASSASSPTLTHNSTDTGLFYSPSRRSTGHYVSYPKPPSPPSYGDKARASLPPTPGPPGTRSPSAMRNARNSLQTAPPIRPPPPSAPHFDLGDCASLKSPLDDLPPDFSEFDPLGPASGTSDARKEERSERSARSEKAERSQKAEKAETVREKSERAERHTRSASEGGHGRSDRDDVSEKHERPDSRATTITTTSSEVRGPLRASAAAHARVYRRQQANATRLVTSPADEPLDYKTTRRKRLGDHNRVARWLHNAVSRPFGLETIDD